MRHRCISAVVLAIAVCLLLPAAGAAQTTGTGTISRTADGRPDLQGVWDFRTLTPLQRPEDRGDQAVLTAEEAASTEQLSRLVRASPKHPVK